MLCPTIKKKITRHTKKKKKNTQYEETDQKSEAGMAGGLDLSVQKLKTVLINMLRAAMDKVDTMQEQRDNVS